MDLPAPVAAGCRTFLEVAPGLVTGPHLSEALAIRHGGDSEYPDDGPARARDTAELTGWVVAAGTT